MSKGIHALIVPQKTRDVLGEEAVAELVHLINEVAAASSSQKVDKSEYDAHTVVIEEKFERFKAEVKHMIDTALLKGLAWMTVLIFGLLGALWALVNTAK